MHKLYSKITVGIIIVFVMLIAILIIAKLDTYQNVRSNEEEIITQSVKDVSSYAEIHAEKISANKKLSFKLGEKFKYTETPPQGLGGPDEAFYIYHTYFIEKIDRINKSDCYLIKKNETQIISTHMDGKPVNEMTSDDTIVCVNTDSGDPVMVKSKDMVGYGDAASMTIDTYSALGRFFYAQWMLSLDENFRWEEKMTLTEPVKQDTTISYEVVGGEKINNRDTFKVEIFMDNKRLGNDREVIQNNKMKSLLWVDKEKRILVKAEVYINNVLIKQINLITELK
jgi:hypothetical protein